MQQANGRRLYIQEVCTRDGFQIEKRFVATDEKVRLVNGLSGTGVAVIEVTSFASPKAIPMLADAEEVLRRIDRVDGVDYAALVPNVRGCERALSANVDVINIVMSASESHNRANLRMSCSDSLSQFARIAELARGHATVNASVSTAFGCPFEGEVSLTRVLEIVERLTLMHLGRITLCDTTGMANPAQVLSVFNATKHRWPEVTFAAHFHDTRSMGMANALAALEAGIDRFDASLGGLGGCPFAPGASGNVCTEDLVHMLSAMGYDTHVDLQALLTLAQRLPSIVQHEVPGQLIKAGPSTRRYPLPPDD